MRTHPSHESRYLGRRCDAVDRDGNRCDLPVGHEQRRGDETRHRTSIDDQPRVWTAPTTSAGLRHYR